jgi:hypothetical protein
MKALQGVVQWPGGKCGGPTQFGEEVGKLHVTSRVNIDQTYVVPTNENASIEVTGTGLNPGGDKIMIVGCQDVCGLAEPAIGPLVTSMKNLGADQVKWPKSSRGSLVPNVGSTPVMLRFAPIRIPSGGTFKVCFCDTDMRPGTFCNTTADFALEVGTIHASGVGYLLEDPRLRSGSFQCKEMSFGGLSCGLEPNAYGEELNYEDASDDED